MTFFFFRKICNSLVERYKNILGSKLKRERSVNTTGFFFLINLERRFIFMFVVVLKGVIIFLLGVMIGATLTEMDRLEKENKMMKKMLKPMLTLAAEEDEHEE